LNSYKIKQKEVLVKTADGRIYRFKIYPRDEGREAYYTRFIPERKEWGIFTEDFEEIGKGKLSEEIEAKLIHEILHYDERVIAPAYSPGRVLLESGMSQFSSLGFDILKIDNFLEDLYSKAILKEWFDKRVLNQYFNHQEQAFRRADFIFNSLLPNLKEISEIEVLRENLWSVTLGNILKAKEIEEIPSKEERVKAISMFYFLLDIALSLVFTTSSRFYELLELSGKMEKMTAYEIAYTLLEEGRVERAVRFHNTIGTLKFILLKLAKEKDPFWRLRWRLEYSRLKQRQNLLDAWNLSETLDFKDSSIKNIINKIKYFL